MMNAPRHEQPLTVDLPFTLQESVERFKRLQTNDDVAELLGLPTEALMGILRRREGKYAYKIFEIQKRSGEARTISSPHPTVKILQKKLSAILSELYRPTGPAHGFVNQRSIVTNARRHLGARTLLNIDLEGFFPSIHFGRVKGILGWLGPSDIASTTLARLCCQPTPDGDLLPQGAPTSPVISNMICVRLDGELLRLARSHDCTYTRYADDISFSTRQPVLPAEIGKHSGATIQLGTKLVASVESNGFRINTNKTRLAGRHQHLGVTGITINEFPNVRRKFVRQIRAMLHAWESFGYDLAEREFHARWSAPSRRPEASKPRFGHVIRGKLLYLRMVRGAADPLYVALNNRLFTLDPELTRFLHPDPVTRPVVLPVRSSTPYSNRAAIRSILHGASGELWWIDPHLSGRVFSELLAEVTSRVSGIRLLSLPHDGIPGAKRDFNAFQNEMLNKGHAVEWRVAPSGQIHDRWVFSDDGTYKVPPANQLFQQSPPASDIVLIPDDQRHVDISTWWDAATPLTRFTSP